MAERQKRENIIARGDQTLLPDVTSLTKTIAIQKEIAKLYPRIEQKIVEFKTSKR